MGVCTFFGHRDCPENIRPILRRILHELIEKHGVDMFYIGNQGHFDAMARCELKELSMEYAHIQYAVVLAYMPTEGSDPSDFTDTMFPEGLEKIHLRYAITWRNKWLLSQASVVVAYVTHSWGGAAQFVEKAKRQGKTVYNLAFFEQPNHSN